MNLDLASAKKTDNASWTIACGHEEEKRRRKLISYAVTQEKACWLVPSGLKFISYEPVENSNIKSAKSLKKDIDCASLTPGKPTKATTLPDDDLATLFKGLHETGTRPVILSFIPGYAEGYVRRQLNPEYPQLLSELRDENFFKDKLLRKGDNVFASMSVTFEQSRFVEEKTRQQSDCREWHRFRTGHITASRMKAVWKTSVDKPTKRLIKIICYPETAASKQVRHSGAVTMDMKG